MVTTGTCKEQLLYEVHNPSEYLTPDVVADFSGISFQELDKDVVAVTGATGRVLTGKLKVSVGYRDGYMADAQLSYGGSYALERSRLAMEIMEERIRGKHSEPEDILFDLIGIDSLFKGVTTNADPQEIRLRLAAKTRTREAAVKLVNELETLYTNGPAAGGGVSKSVSEIIAIQSILIDKDKVAPKVEYFKS